MAIRIDADIMEQRSVQFRSEAESVGRVMKNMDDLLRGLQMEWDGEATRSYETQYFSELRPSLQQTQEMITNIARTLDKMARDMREADAAAAASFRN